jgi:hypothetical protein
LAKIISVLSKQTPDEGNVPIERRTSGDFCGKLKKMLNYFLSKAIVIGPSELSTLPATEEEGLR